MSNDGDTPIGYCRPPEQHRINLREVRNPWGRKGKPKAEIDFLDGPFEFKMDGKVVRVTRRQALDHALFKEGLSGNVSAVRELDRRGRDRALATKAGDDESLASEDQQAFDRCLERLRRETASAKEGETASASPAPRRSGGVRR